MSGAWDCHICRAFIDEYGIDEFLDARRRHERIFIARLDEACAAARGVGERDADRERP